MVFERFTRITYITHKVLLKYHFKFSRFALENITSSSHALRSNTGTGLYVANVTSLTDLNGRGSEAYESAMIDLALLDQTNETAAYFGGRGSHAYNGVMIDIALNELQITSISASSGDRYNQLYIFLSFFLKNISLSLVSFSLALKK